MEEDKLTIAQQLGEYICRANPYTRQQDSPSMKPRLKRPKYYKSVEWDFKTASYRVNLAPDPVLLQTKMARRLDYLIGFEGSGGIELPA